MTDYGFYGMMAFFFAIALADVILNLVRMARAFKEESLAIYSTDQDRWGCRAVFYLLAAIVVGIGLYVAIRCAWFPYEP